MSVADKQHQVSEWVERYTDDLMSWAVLKLKDSEKAKDFVQETFLTAFDKFDQFKGDSHPKTWLIRILSNKILDHQRKLSRQKTYSSDDFSEPSFFNENGSWKTNIHPDSWNHQEEHLLDNPEFLKVMKSCMQNLKSDWYQVITAFYFEKKKGKEICQDLNLSSSNYWQILRRGKLQLRSCLEKNWYKS